MSAARREPRPDIRRSRELIFLPEDAEALLRRLCEAFEEVWIVDWDPYDLDRPLVRYETLHDPNYAGTLRQIWLPPKGWEPPLAVSIRGELIRGSPPRFFWFHSGHWEGHRMPEDAFEEPTRMKGTIMTNHDKEDAEAAATVRKVWRIIAGISSNRLESVGYWDLKPLGLDIRWAWAGFHAIRWCLESPRRTLQRSLRPQPEAIAAMEKALGPMTGAGR